MLGFDKRVSGKHKLINDFRDQLFDSVGSFVQLNCLADWFPAELFLFALDTLNLSAIALLSCALRRFPTDQIDPGHEKRSGPA